METVLAILGVLFLTYVIVKGLNAIETTTGYYERKNHKHKR